MILGHIEEEEKEEDEDAHVTSRYFVAGRAIFSAYRRRKCAIHWVVVNSCFCCVDDISFFFLFICFYFVFFIFIFFFLKQNEKNQTKNKNKKFFFIWFYQFLFFFEPLKTKTKTKTKTNTLVVCCNICIYVCFLFKYRAQSMATFVSSATAAPMMAAAAAPLSPLTSTPMSSSYFPHKKNSRNDHVIMGSSIFTPSTHHLMSTVELVATLHKLSQPTAEQVSTEIKFSDHMCVQLGGSKTCSAMECNHCGFLGCAACVSIMHLTTEPMCYRCMYRTQWDPILYFQASEDKLEDKADLHSTLHQTQVRVKFGSVFIHPCATKNWARLFSIVRAEEKKVCDDVNCSHIGAHDATHHCRCNGCSQSERGYKCRVSMDALISTFSSIRTACSSYGPQIELACVSCKRGYDTCLRRFDRCWHYTCNGAARGCASSLKNCPVCDPEHLMLSYAAQYKQWCARDLLPSKLHKATPVHWSWPLTMRTKSEISML